MFGEVLFAGIYRDIVKIIGQPVCFGKEVQQNNEVSNASTSAELDYYEFQDYALQSSSIVCRKAIILLI